MCHQFTEHLICLNAPICSIKISRIGRCHLYLLLGLGATSSLKPMRLMRNMDAQEPTINRVTVLQY